MDSGTQVLDVPAREVVHVVDERHVIPTWLLAVATVMLAAMTGGAFFFAWAMWQLGKAASVACGAGR